MSAELHRRVFGDGPQLAIALHGWAGTGAIFEPLAEELGPEWTVWGVDLPGYGESVRLAGPASGWTFEAAVEALDLGLRPRLQARARDGRDDAPVLVGTCSGAIVALGLARRWALERAAGEAAPTLTRLVVAEAFAEMPWYFKLFLKGSLGRVAYWSSFGNPLGRWLTDRGVSKHRQDGGDLADSFKGLDSALTLGWLRLLDAVPGPEHFAGIDAPTVLVRGGDSFPEIAEHARRWARVWPGLAELEIPDAGHLVLEDRPDLAARVVAGRHRALVGTRAFWSTPRARGADRPDLEPFGRERADPTRGAATDARSRTPRRAPVHEVA